MSDPESFTDLSAQPIEPRNGLAKARVVLKPKRALPFLSRHPWVYAGAIQYIEGDFEDGDVVDLCGERDKFIARGIINTCSKLQVRLYTWNAEEPLDDAFWRHRVQSAIDFRRQLKAGGSGAARRQIFSE